MSVPNQKINISYKSNGENIFVIPFDFVNDEQIKVFITPPNAKDKAEQIYGKDFDIDNNSVVFVEPVPEKSIVTIQRSTDIDNDLNLLNNTKLPANVLNYAFDKLTMICQELQEQLSHTLIYDGDEQLNYAELLEKLVEVKDYMENADELSASVLKAAVSAAQSLASALQSRKFRDEAEEFSKAAAADSDIATHNNYQEAHPYIRQLIDGLNLILEQHLDAYGTHIEDYEKHITDNANAHQTFTNDIQQLDNRVVILENASSLGKGNMYYAFGYNNKGQLGINWTSNVTAAPIEHFAMRNVTAVAVSANCGTAISGGRIYVTGNGGNGLCGPDRQACYGFRPLAPVDNIYNFSSICCYDETAFALTNDGKLYSWGRGDLHCLGDGTIIARSVPRHIMPDLTFKKVAAGCRVMLALTTDGKIYTCGASDYGALGHAVAQESSALLKEISGLENIVDIASGGFYNDKKKFLNFCAAIQQNEDEPAELYTWGYNGYGQLGFGNTTNLSAPQKLDIEFEPAKISCGAAHLAVLSKDGKIYITGAKAALNASANQTSFKVIESDDVYTDIAAGRNITYLLTSYKHLYAVGTPSYGSMLTNSASATPVELVQGNIEAVYSGCQHYGCAFTIAQGGEE